MSDQNNQDDQSKQITGDASGLPENGQPEKPLSPAARRALEEAAERRAQSSNQDKPAPKEIDGRGGLDPARYGDWEVKGILSDF